MGCLNGYSDVILLKTDLHRFVTHSWELQHQWDLWVRYYIISRNACECSGVCDVEGRRGWEGGCSKADPGEADNSYALISRSVVTSLLSPPH